MTHITDSTAPRKLQYAHKLAL